MSYRNLVIALPDEMFDRLDEFVRAKKGRTKKEVVVEALGKRLDALDEECKLAAQASRAKEIVARQPRFGARTTDPLQDEVEVMERVYAEKRREEDDEEEI